MIHSTGSSANTRITNIPIDQTAYSLVSRCIG
jgi:hypothetical protein